MPAPNSYSDRVLLTIHGVTSDNGGLVELRRVCQEKLPGLIVDSYYYQYVMPIRDLTEPVKDIIFTSIRDKIRLVWLDRVAGQGRKLFVAAHSFGTLAVIRALEMQIPGVTIEGLILFGSIVRPNQVWDGWVDGGQLSHPPFAVIRPLDGVVRFGKKVGGGDSGAAGFTGNGAHLPYQTYKTGGHTAYYPDDVDDVVAILQGGVASPARTTEDAWYKNCGRLTKARIFLQKTVGMMP